MSVINNNLLLGDEGYLLERSLRFRSSASAYLNRTPAIAGNQKTWTMSFWTKRGKLSYSNDIIGCYSSGSDTGNFEARFNTSDKFYVILWNYYAETNAVFRDPSAWYHVVLVLDTTQAGTSSGSKIKVYINGTLQSWATDSISSSISQNDNLIWNSTTAQYFCRWFASDGGTYYYDGYLAEINFIDGQALTSSSFGQTSATTGVWIPKKYTGTYGTNGFYLPFTDNSALTTSSNAGLGKDFSGNSNYWTTNNISITSGVTYDSMTDVPTLTSATAANYCVLNPLDKAANFTLAGANLNFTPANTSDLYSCRSTFQIPSTGKWIWEVTNTNSAYMITAGLLSGSTALVGQQTVTCASMTVGSIGTFFSTSQWMNSTTTWSVTNVGNGDTLVIAYDADAGKIWFGRVASGGTTVTWYNTSGTADPSTGTDPRASSITAGGWFAGFGAYYTPSGASANFGQRPFSFTNIPTGFKALNTFNLPTPTIGATASSQANKYFDVSLYTGTNATLSVTNSGSMQPDLVWIKTRSTSSRNTIFDSARGITKALWSDSTDAEGTANTGTGLTAFASNGFTLGTEIAGTSGSTNTSGVTYVAWQWKANGSGSSNTAGSITSTVSANTSAGFSIVTYTGTGANATVGHGLGVAPKMIIWKNRNATASWVVWHTNFSSIEYIYLNLTNAVSSSGGSTVMNSTLPTSSVFSLGTYSDVNGNGNGIVAYCFAPVAGYSAMGSYTGNGSSDGVFVFTGFRPRFVMIKRTDSGNNWFILDTSRDTFNLANDQLLPNSSAAESTNTDCNIDILSNGFKLRTALDASNGSGGTYIYMAVAENPFKYAVAR